MTQGNATGGRPVRGRPTCTGNCTEGGDRGVLIDADCPVHNPPASPPSAGAATPHAEGADAEAYRTLDEPCPACKSHPALAVITSGTRAGTLVCELCDYTETPAPPPAVPQAPERSEPGLAEFRVTFGQRYAREVHPWSAEIHPDGWLTVAADDEQAARALVEDALGSAWAHIYPAETFDQHHASLFPRGEVARLNTAASAAAAPEGGESR